MNCALMGLDWRVLTWWEYQAALSVWNDRHSDGAVQPPSLDPERVKAAMALVSTY
ncbi:hypothetical protein [Sphingomonas oleivorans]|uniref:hypothetical protein n=1 Tax=Sphingomonas oleivorans TaxID=1735121 RepID=UPI0013FD4EC6|nr:hypothetical protein [Sphingomonas oleivorans]